MSWQIFSFIRFLSIKKSGSLEAWGTENLSLSGLLFALGILPGISSPQVSRSVSNFFVILKKFSLNIS